MEIPLFEGSSVESERILYTPSVFARTNLLHLQEVGTLQAVRPHTNCHENLSSYLFFIVVNGEGTVESNGEKCFLKKGDAAFLDCKKPYFHRSSENLWTLKWVHFYGPNMTSIYEKYLERGGKFAFFAQQPDEYADIIDDIYGIADSSEYIRDMKIYERLTHLLTRLLEECWNGEKQRVPINRRYNLQEVKDYLDLNFALKITLDELSNRFFINKFYLTRIFKEQFGISVTDYLNHVRITHAKRLLRFSDTSIEIIADSLGISDANYFSRLFKKIEGISPGEYRRLW